MQEATRKILAYQKGPLILLCRDAGRVPEQFLSSLSSDEKQYLRARCDPGLLRVVESLLSVLGAAGVAPSTTPLLADGLRDPVVVNDTIDSVFLPLAAEQSTQQWLRQEASGRFLSELRSLIKKTRQRFGAAQLVVLGVLPRFMNGQMVADELVCFGEQVIEGARESPLYAADVVDPRLLSSLCEHWSFVGVHPKFFSSDSLTEQLIGLLSEIRISVVAS